VLARPIYVHTDHVARLQCPNGCLGVELDIHTTLHADEHRGCAICELDATREIPAGTRTLRQCGNRLCHGRFHQTSYDEFHIDERIQYLRQKAARMLRRSAA
jgi:hypothetical protein